MKQKLRAFSRSYAAALGAHLKGGPRASLKKASALGTKAVSLGLETLDLANIHEAALLTAIEPKKSPRQRTGLIERAQVFFIEANAPIERTHAASSTASLQWVALRKTLHKRTDELAVTNRDLERKIVQRKTAEQTLKRRNEHNKRLLKESQSMQESLRVLARRVLTEQEDERGQISSKLRDEIGQVLLGINVRLLTLKQKGTMDAKLLLKDIANTQALVEKSMADMRRVARKLQPANEK